MKRVARILRLKKQKRRRKRLIMDHRNNNLTNRFERRKAITKSENKELETGGKERIRLGRRARMWK